MPLWLWLAAATARDNWQMDLVAVRWAWALTESIPGKRDPVAWDASVLSHPALLVTTLTQT